MLRILERNGLTTCGDVLGHPADDLVEKGLSMPQQAAIRAATARATLPHFVDVGLCALAALRPSVD